MKLKKIFNLPAALLLAGVTLFSSCETEEQEHFHELEFDTEGIDLQKKEGVYTAEIPASEIAFTITGKGKHKDVTYITAVSIDGVPQERPCDFEKDEPPFLDSYPVLSGEWGKIDYETKTPPYRMAFHLTANENQAPRVFVFDLGYGYWHEQIRIVQQGAGQPGE